MVKLKVIYFLFLIGILYGRAFGKDVCWRGLKNKNKKTGNIEIQKYDIVLTNIRYTPRYFTYHDYLGVRTADDVEC